MSLSFWRDSRPSTTWAENLTSPRKQELDADRRQWGVLPSALPQASPISHSFSNKYFIQQIINKHHECPSHCCRQWRGHSSEQDRYRSGLLELTFWSGCYTWKGILLLCPCPHLLYRQNETDRLTWPLQAFSPLFRILGNQQMMAMFHVVGKTKTYKDVPSHSLEPTTMWPQMTKGIWQIWLSYISGDYPE